VHRATYRIDHARKLYQHAVASGFDNTATVIRDARIDQFATVRLEGCYCPDLIGAHQSAVTHHVSGQNCRKPALHGLILSFVNSSSLPAISWRHKSDATSTRRPFMGVRFRFVTRPIQST
jgi:hypothetical protein